MATTYNYTTEREIIDQARQRVRESGTGHATADDQTIIVLGYLADMVRQSVAPSVPPTPRGLMGMVLQAGGPWALVLTVLVIVLARSAGVDLTGLLGPAG